MHRRSAGFQPKSLSLLDYASPNLLCFWPLEVAPATRIRLYHPDSLVPPGFASTTRIRFFDPDSSLPSYSVSTTRLRLSNGVYHPKSPLHVAKRMNSCSKRMSEYRLGSYPHAGFGFRSVRHKRNMPVPRVSAKQPASTRARARPESVSRRGTALNQIRGATRLPYRCT